MDPNPGYKYYRVYTNPNEPKGGPPFSTKLWQITRYYPEDYLPPVTRQGGDIVELISDESTIQDMLCVSLIILPFLRDKNEIESKLEDLVVTFGLSTIHFVDIFGRENVLGNRTETFMEEYCKIVSAVPMSALALCKDKSELLLELGETDMEQELLYFQLFWNNFQRILPVLTPYSLVHISWEQENNLSEGLCEKLITKLYSGIWGIDEKGLNNRHCSICKHPHFFSKKALFFSSVSDLVAYANNKISYSLWKGVPEKKILNDSKRILILRALKKIFANYSGLPIRDLIDRV